MPKKFVDNRQVAILSMDWHTVGYLNARVKFLDTGEIRIVSQYKIKVVF